ncbi:DUF4350 domain-containing protein [Novosphingobium sp. FSY-8]|uniref:DUF4350 domain-containing protein n=1 Tax=Novosphingobium ovatum TaxID=1908523 RepID=A0ABW9XG75_9SPHN|nr:DUF4350 domain-containing protein [Novosphingobium ovatum]NBC37560.1 DUF4350 domain-containing protein [Novosphingobium ovatum]
MSAGADAIDAGVGRARPTFSVGTVLALVVLGAGLFLAVLWMLGNGVGLNNDRDNIAHGRAVGLNGYAGLARMAQAAGHPLRYTHDTPAARQPGLLIITPQQWVDGADIQKLIDAHCSYGPTLLIVPKWWAVPASIKRPGAQKGWVQLGEAQSPEWHDFQDAITLSIVKRTDPVARWVVPEGAPALTTRLPHPEAMQISDAFDEKDRPVLRPLVTAADGAVLAARPMDMPCLPEGLAVTANAHTPFPQTFVFEPDLMNNMALSTPQGAAMAEALVNAAMGRVPASTPITFDMSLAGQKRTPSLLTLAVTPPYLAATLALVLAALAAGWRAFCRFGPPLAPLRAIALGKSALVANAAALIRRAGRLHLLPGPYADGVRGRLIAALGLPQHADPAQSEAAIDRALHARAPDLPPFSATSAALRTARKPTDILRHAQTLHAIERTLTR